MNKPLISIIITNYNYGQYVTKAVDSVLNQTYPNIELIIINDGSTDNSDEVIRNIISNNQNSNIKYINRKNKGVTYTRNEGLEIASGEYLSYLDADDFFNNNYISKSYKIAKEFNADVVYPNWHFVGEWLGRPDTNFSEFSPKLLQLQKLHVTPASLIRKNVIKNHRFEVEKVAEDWDFFIGLSLDDVNFKLAKDNYINYRIRKGTRGSINDPKEDTKCFVEILEKYKLIYGNQVINPEKLVSDRHPNVVMQVLRMRYPNIIIKSIKNDGPRATSRKIMAKMVTKNKPLWKTIGMTRDVKYQRLMKTCKISYSPSVELAVVIHLYYPELWPLISKKLANINIPFDLFVSVQLKDKNISIDKVNKYHQITNVIALPNRGRDVLPFLLLVKNIYKAQHYEYVLKLHSKKSLHREDGKEWLESLLDQLIPTDLSSIMSTLKLANTGAIGPASHVVSLSKYMGGNRNLMAYILEKITDKKLIEEILFNQNKYPFFGGTMFWCRLDLLAPLIKSKITPADFNTERGQLDTTTAHALERTLGKALHTIAKRKMYIVNRGVVSELPDKSYISNYKYVE